MPSITRSAYPVQFIDSQYKQQTPDVSSSPANLQASVVRVTNKPRFGSGFGKYVKKFICGLGGASKVARNSKGLHSDAFRKSQPPINNRPAAATLKAGAANSAQSQQQTTGSKAVKGDPQGYKRASTDRAKPEAPTPLQVKLQETSVIVAARPEAQSSVLAGQS